MGYWTTNVQDIKPVWRHQEVLSLIVDHEEQAINCWVYNTSKENKSVWVVMLSIFVSWWKTIIVINQVNIENDNANLQHVHTATDHVVTEAILVPFELNNIFQGISIEHWELFRVSACLHKLNISILNISCARFFINQNMVSQNWYHVQSVTNFVNLSAILLTIWFWHIKLILRKNCFIMLTNVKNGFIVWSKILSVICVGSRPFIVIKFKLENIWAQKIFNFDTFFNQLSEVFQKQVRGSVIVLVLDDVVYDNWYSLDLVVSQSLIKSRSVEVLLIFYWSLLNFVLVKNWVTFVKIFIESLV